MTPFLRDCWHMAAGAEAIAPGEGIARTIIGAWQALIETDIGVVRRRRLYDTRGDVGRPRCDDVGDLEPSGLAVPAR